MSDSQQWPQGNPGGQQWPNVQGQLHPHANQQWPPPQQQPPQWQPPGQQPPQGWGPPPQQPPVQARPARKRRSGVGCILGFFGVLAVIIVVAITASHGSTPASSPAATQGATQAAAPAAATTVTYVVTGSAADVTYGPEGSSASGSVPLHKTVAIPSSPPGYYSIDAQLNGSGSVSCEILVGGKVVSKATASGSYNIASCEIVQDPLSGAWQDANGA